MGRMGCFGIIIIGVLAFMGSTEAQLKMGFYNTSCPKAEKIVQGFVDQHIHNAPSLAATLLRMHFHDCFVRGGPFWRVPTGRRDGLISRSSEALSSVPSPMINFTTLRTLFANQGLDLKDLVLLSGAHTIGIAHCQSFSNRLYNFTGIGDEDPALDSEYAANLKARKCKSISDNTTIVEMDPGSRKTFDLSYYKLLLKRRGLFQSDASLTTNSNTSSMIRQILQGSIDFRSEFSKSMEKMGRIRVKTGSNGEIRRQCALVNS
ncbi:hypothetical protein NC653_037580 [Populus alba x Populus x berolinensis]|uniref:peroxidase n=2 Tax=Populus TaxID=3689 RepID=A0A4U5QD62_POPAL|nr:hypothetical protein NC653_037580 [Populus alba x Populus x berolinensis]TKS08364.1 hypothetical protein D5086_0000103860 [Populus alba]